jgi:predicted metal-dependent phosphoesterase TrpH
VRIDLHLHTWHSDGSLAPEQVLALVRAQRLKAWAITDHDSLLAWRGLREEAGLIPGVEITAAEDGFEVHVVALGIDGDDPVFEAFLAGIRVLRRERFALLVAHAAQHYGRPLALEDALDPRSECPSRVHLAQALQRAGCVRHAHSAFQECLGDQQVRALDLPPFPDLPTTVAAIRAAGGVALLAHPGIYPSIDRIHQLMRLGDLDGLEVNHPNLQADLRLGLEALAIRHGWLRSCGSDFHWAGRRSVGDWRLSHAEAAPLLERVGWRDALVAAG